MARKRPKYRGDKPKSLKPAALAETAAPPTAAEYSQVDPQALIDRERRKSNKGFPAVIIEADSITQAVQRSASEQVAAAISKLPAEIASSPLESQLPPQKPVTESDIPTPIPRSYNSFASDDDEPVTSVKEPVTVVPVPVDSKLIDTVIPAQTSTGLTEDDVVLEILEEEEDDEKAAKFVDAMAIEEMLEDVFDGLQQVASATPSETAKPATPVNKPASEKPPVSIPQAQPKTSFATQPHSAPTIVPPALTVTPPAAADSESQFDPHQTGDHTHAAELFWAFFNSPSADRYHRAQLKFEKTKNIADKPDLDAMVRDFHRRKGGSGGLKK